MSARAGRYSLVVAGVALAGMARLASADYNFPQIWEIRDNPGYTETLDNGVQVTADILAVGTAEHHINQGGTSSVSGFTDWTEIGASPSSSYDLNWPSPSQGSTFDYEDYIAVVLSFDEPVSLTGDFIVTDVDWNQMCSVFGLDNGTLVKPTNMTVGSSLTLYADSAGWANQPAGYTLPAGNQVDTVIGPNSSGDESATTHRVTYGFETVGLTDLVFVFAEAQAGGSSNGGALVYTDFSQEDAAVVQTTPEPHAAVLLLMYLGATCIRRRSR